MHLTNQINFMFAFAVYSLPRIVVILLGLAATNRVIAKEPYLPINEEFVVAELKPAVVSMSRKLRDGNSITLSSSWNEGDRAAFLREVLAAYSLATDQGSARAYGHALALANRWPPEQSPPSLLRLVRASLLQRNHEFEAAQAELDLVVATEPDNEQALVALAQIGLVTGDYDKVQQYCDRLLQVPLLLSALNCQAQLDAVTGKASLALNSVESALARPSLPVADALELYSTAATIAHRLGNHQKAGHHYQQALLLGGTSNYLVLNYAQWLLEQGRPDAVVELLAGPSKQEDQYEMKVFYLAALNSLGQTGLADSVHAELAGEIERLSQRGDDSPQKVIARYALAIEGDFNQALLAAKKNWRKQKEPGDALLLSEAALAAHDIETLAMIRDWRDQTGLEDVRLDEVLAQGGVVR